MYINKNTYEELEDCYKLSLICNGTTHHTYFDKSLYNILNVYHWRLSQKKRKYYVCTGQSKNGGKILYMANIIMNFTPDKIMEVDHIDGDSLNNRISNLRIIKRIDNIHNCCVSATNNTTGIRGISFDKRYNKYVVDFYYNKRRVYFKPFKTLEEAVYIRMRCEILFLKEFRNTSDDVQKLLLISKLSNNDIEILEKYLHSRIGDLND
jgi:hypothetical protein